MNLLRCFFHVQSVKRIMQCKRRQSVITTMVQVVYAFANVELFTMLKFAMYELLAGQRSPMLLNVSQDSQIFQSILNTKQVISNDTQTVILDSTIHPTVLYQVQ